MGGGGEGNVHEDQKKFLSYVSHFGNMLDVPVHYLNEDRFLLLSSSLRWPSFSLPPPPLVSLISVWPDREGIPMMTKMRRTRIRMRTRTNNYLHPNCGGEQGGSG